MWTFTNVRALCCLWLPSYSVKKDSLKKLSKGSNSETGFFLGDRLSSPHTYCFKVSSRYCIQLLIVRTRSAKNLIKGREVTQQIEKGRAFFCMRHLNLIHIAIKFHKNIPYGYLIWHHCMHKDIMKKIIKGK